MGTDTESAGGSAATSSGQLRDRVVDFLRRELIGPDPIAPHVQANGEEILVSDPPRVRYSAGILFPQAALTTSAFDIDPDEISQNEDDFGDESVSLPPQDAGDGLPPVDKSNVGLEEVEEMISLTNSFLPSAVGFSCMTDLPPSGLLVKIEAATYTSQESLTVGHDGTEYKQRHFHRKPFSAVVELSYASLMSQDVYSERIIVPGEGASGKLSIHILSRYTSKQKATVRFLTLTLVNTHTAVGRTENEKCFFQVGLSLRSADGSAVFMEYPRTSLVPDEEEASLDLLYRHKKTYAVGHGCAAQWNGVCSENGCAQSICSDILPVHEIKPIVPRLFSDLPLGMYDLSDKGSEGNLEPILNGLCERYAGWIENQISELDSLEGDDELLQTAARHLKNCHQCLYRMREGVKLVLGNSRVRAAFRLANRAMLLQQLHYSLGTDASRSRDWELSERGSLKIAPVIWPDIMNPPARKGAWYPFQLAFLLMNLGAFTSEDHPGRKIVDLIWFPTGGGKTEAYLGLTAFSIILRRLNKPDDAGTCALMRYTLRLLTTQQFQRAASLICAIEKMRRDGDLPGPGVSIGLWAGGALTPNNRQMARDALEKLAAGEMRENPFVVLVCPWCGARMGPVSVGGHVKVAGYEISRPGQFDGGRTVVFRCADPTCDFGGEHSLPLTVIDEDLYACPPTLLLGTVDKFAMLPWRAEAGAFFGITHNYSPPDLIIQDELHLISGPLGSMVGHYETVINNLCINSDGSLPGKGPKIIASTATISRAGDQCHSLFNCGIENVFQYPPQYLKAGDSFFAYEAEKEPGRMYVGVHASALGSHVTSQVRTIAALLQATLSIPVAKEEVRDPYWTLIAYYNSLRELGHAATLLRADIREYLSAMWLRLGIEKAEEGKSDIRRFINRDLELTSRIPSGQIPEALQKLFVTYPTRNNDRPVDVALATTMISVGVDVPRLGLMAVAGQPKTTSEYIQATSRVGREKPGLVVTIYNSGKPRDRSHYEHFHSYHSAMYRAVEPTSVTPFSPPVRDRALHAILASLVRYRGDTGNRERPSPVPADQVFEYIMRSIDERVAGVDPDEQIATLQELREKINHWRRIAPPRYGGWGSQTDEIPLMYPAGSAPLPAWSNKSWATPSSMRDVDASCEAQVIGIYPRPQDDDLFQSEDTDV